MVTEFDNIFEAVHRRLCERTGTIRRLARFENRNEGWLLANSINAILDMEETGSRITVESVNSAVQLSGWPKKNAPRPDLSLRLDGQPFYLELKILESGRTLGRGIGQVKKTDLPKLKVYGICGAILILSYGLDSDFAGWDILSEDLKGIGLTRLREEDIEGYSTAVLSLWQYQPAA